MTSDACQVLRGDCLEVLAELAPGSVDAVVTDPPYGLEFMGKEWDGADGFRRSLSNAADRDSASVRASTASPEYRTVGAGQRGKPGIGERPTEWVSGQGWNAFRCRNCGHLSHGGSPCQCERPEFARADNRWLIYQQWCQAWAAECLRVLKPGGYLVAFGGTRTYHRMVCAIEDAGFEIRDSLHWVYGSGFPKSLDVSKAIDKAAGVQRTEMTGIKAGHGDFAGRTDAHSSGGRSDGWERPWRDAPDAVARSHMTFAPATEHAAHWEGWGTALKPAHEPIVLARKPLAGTVARNVLEHGTGALNIGGCRVAHVSAADLAKSRASNKHADWGSGPRENNVLGDMSQHTRASQGNYDGSAGRWPPNILLSHSPACDGECVPGCPVSEMDAQSGVSVSRFRPRSERTGGSATDLAMRTTGTTHSDTGGASRFFPCFRYQAKAPAKERPRVEGEPAHPTVKPLALMRWLVRLVTPPGGLVLDPFAGTGTTGEAALAEGFRAVLIERDPSYIELISKRLEAA